MDAYEFGAVKAEKSKALRRYRRNHRFKTTLRQASEIAIALLLLSCYFSSAISLAIELARDSLRQLACLLTKPLSVFLLSNVIIATVFVLSGKEGDRSRTPSVYDEYVACRRVSSTGNSPATENDSDLYKQIVPYCPPSSSPSRDDSMPRIAVPVPEVPNHAPLETVGAVTETHRVVVEAVERPTIFPAVRDIPVVAIAAKPTSNSTRKQCRRTQSAAAAKKLTRSQSEQRLTVAASTKGRRTMAAPPVRSCCSQRSVEDLSDEEFNLRIEKYIAKTRRILAEENMADATGSATAETRPRATGYHSV